MQGILQQIEQAKTRKWWGYWIAEGNNLVTLSCEIKGFKNESYYGSLIGEDLSRYNFQAWGNNEGLKSFDFLGGIQLPVVSKFAIDILTPMINNCEIIPFPITVNGGNYFIINPLSIFNEIINKSEDSFGINPGVIFTKIDENKLNSLHVSSHIVCCQTKAINHSVFFSSELVQLIIKHRLSGIGFCSPETASFIKEFPIEGFPIKKSRRKP